MNDVKVTLNQSGIVSVMRSDMMMSAVKNAAIKQGEIETSFVGFDRVQVRVKQGGSDADRTDHT